MTENNYIKLKFDKTITRLAGFPYGEAVFNEQIKGYVDFSKPITIEFPEQIVKIASSFVQGFFKGIIYEVGIEEIGKSVEIVTSNLELKQTIISNLLWKCM